MIAERATHARLHDGPPGDNGTDNLLVLDPIKIYGVAQGAKVHFDPVNIVTDATHFSIWDEEGCLAWLKIPGALGCGIKRSVTSLDFTITTIGM